MKNADGVIDITQRLEKWCEPTLISDVCVSVSSHGRIKLFVDDKVKTFTFVESVQMLAAIVNAYKQAGYEVY